MRGPRKYFEIAICACDLLIRDRCGRDLVESHNLLMYWICSTLNILNFGNKDDKKICLLLFSFDGVSCALDCVVKRVPADQSPQSKGISW